MDGTQYDMYLLLLADYELRAHREVIESAQRLLRHQGGYASEDYTSELEAIDAEIERRRIEKARAAD